MPERNLSRDFAEMVKHQLTPNAQELWGRMAQEFLAKGPEAVKSYLESQRTFHEANISSRLEAFKEE